MEGMKGAHADGRIEIAEPAPKGLVFDLDETLAVSFQPPKPEMIARLKEVLDLIPTAIVSGAGFDRIERDVLSALADSKHLDRLYIMPNSGTQGFTWHDGWNMEYDFALTDDQRAEIRTTLERLQEELPMLSTAPYLGERIVDRGAQIAFTAVGVNAPPELKKNWDKDGMKRREIAEVIRARLPGYDVLTGGASTIDITSKGINKAYGVRWLSERLRLKPEEMLYVGDALREGGNDAVVIPTGIRTQAVTGPDETLQVIDKVLHKLHETDLQ